MEEFYYQKMDRQKQAVYHGMLQGVRQLADQIQLPRVDGKELYDIFFQMRLDHPEIFWVVGFSWKYYPDSPNLIFVPEYLFEKGKIKEHIAGGKACTAGAGTFGVGKRKICARFYMQKCTV